MLDSCSFILVARNEAHRLEPLLSHVRPYFAKMVLGVQDSTDATLTIAEAFADELVTDEARGYGDATFPALMQKVTTRFCFRCDADEWPTIELLDSLPQLERKMRTEDWDGAWIPFRSWIEGVEWEVPHSHMRFWASRFIWPGTLHSRPATRKDLHWPTGFIEHRKSLDEHVQGYLGYLAVKDVTTGQKDHNRMMIRSACRGTAESKGWDFVRNHAWWPQVADIVAEDGPLPEF